MTLGVYDKAGRERAASDVQVAPPIGAQLPYAGSADPPGGAWLIADGRLIDQAAYPDYMTWVGHAYNGGVDPGSGKVRLPDKRGRVSVGADNMGTAQGAASRIPNSNRLRGQSAGEERHQLTVAELASHTHPTGYNGLQAVNAGTQWSVALYTAPGATSASGGDAPHNNMQPYEVDLVIVRVR